MTKIIEVKNLTKEYGELVAVNDLSFSVEKGEIIGLLGPNGSGKTTTINCILSLLKYNKGEVNVFGKKMTPDSNKIKEKIGVVFQDVAVFDELTVYENIEYFCSLYIKDKIIREDYIFDAIDLVGLTEFVSFRPKQLSGGLLRRLNIACGIAHKPELIFFDEPTVAVDPQSRNHILEGIKTLNKNGSTIIYTSHYMEEVEQLCDRIIIIDKGKIIASGSKNDLKALVKVSLKATFEIDGLTKEQLTKIEKNKIVVSSQYEDNNLYVSFKDTSNLSDFLDYLQKENIIYKRIFSELPTLNDVFLELTGKELRD